MATNLGWHVTYLGASCPRRRLPERRSKTGRGMALSLVYPEDDASLPGELTRLREALPAETSLLVGGAPCALPRVLVRLGAKLVEDLGQLGAALDGLRSLRAGQACEGIYPPNRALASPPARPGICLFRRSAEPANHHAGLLKFEVLTAGPNRYACRHPN